MKRILAIVLLGLSSLVSAQTVQTTPNQITSGTTHTWTGVTTGSLPSTYMPGGPVPLYDPSTNTISFSYGQATAAQTFAINQALQSVGAGVTVQGYSYSWDIRNMNGDNRQGGTDTLTATVKTYAANNSTILRTDTWTYSTKIDWTNFNGIVNYANPGLASDYGNLSVQFSGKDSGFWAGYFGPQVRNVSIGLRYTVDPCYSNPAYSPTCANYGTVSISENLLSGTTGVQAYAINSALALAGAGATIHGFNYGYNYYVAGRTCAIWDIFGLCLSGYNYSDAGVNTSLTNSAGTTIYTDNQTHNGGNNGTSGTYAKEYRLSSSVPMSTLGTFTMSPWTSGNASITNMYSQAVYTADPCVTNPLSSTSCSGYAAAYLVQQCAINALYDSTCPGYAAAVFSQQCTANQLSDPACPGYAAAYLTQQCTINPLYSTACTGYSTALSECNSNPLTHSYCPAYQTATTGCAANPLYGSYCTGYSTASAECSANPLSHTYCTDYSSASTQCSLNPLYASYCPGYQFAYDCSLDGLYSKQCSNYGEAYAKKNILNIGSTTTTTVTTTDSSTIVLAQTNSDPVAQAAPVVADPVVNSVVTTKSTATTSETNPAAAVKITQTAPAPTATVTQSNTDKKSDSSTTTQTAKTEDKPADKPKTSREQLAEQRREAARKEAVEKGKELANEMGKAADMAAQVEVQNVVIQAMGFTPGFDNYNRSILPDAPGYRPYTVYNNQRNVDSPSGRGLFGGSDVVHQRMVDAQYNLGN